MSTYGSHPEQMTVKLTLGDGAHLVATSANGWAGPVSLVWGPDDGQWTEETSTLTDVGTVDGTEVSWTLTIAEVTARAAFPYVRLVDNGMTMQAGEVITWTGGLGSTTTQTIASLTAGPPGPTAVSADADNVATLGSDGLIFVPPGGSGPTLTATDAPTAPAEGTSASYLVSSAVVWPAGLVWSTDPDGGTAPTITDAALVSLFTVGGTTYAVMGSTYPVPVAPDTTDPTPGTLAVVTTSTTADLTVTGAMDETELDAAPYAYSSDNGATWTAYQAGATYEFTGLTASTSYTFRHRVRDAAGNVATGTAVTESTAAPSSDTTPPTAGTLAASSITDTGFTLTVTGASDETALHAAPYAFSTDNGATYSAWQASNAYAASGLTAETAYDCVHKVRDAAANEATGTAIEVTTGAAAPDPLAAFNFAYRFESDSITGLSNGDPVPSWPDTSGNGQHATQAVAADQPAFVANAFGSLPGLTFGTATTKKLVTPIGPAIPQPITYFVVGSCDAGGYVSDGATSTERNSIYINLNPAAEMYAGGSRSAVSFATPGVYVFQFNGNNTRSWDNNGNASTPGNAGAQGITGLTIGNRHALNNSNASVIGAHLTIAAAVSTTDINTIGSYLATKYGFTWTNI